jgi:hypothetical protein
VWSSGCGSEWYRLDAGGVVDVLCLYDQTGMYLEYTVSEAPAMVYGMRCVCGFLTYLWRFQDVYRVPPLDVSIVYGMIADPAGDGGLLYRATWRVAHDLLHDARGRASYNGL